MYLPRLFYLHDILITKGEKKMFKKNEGYIDRTIRVLLALVLLPVGLFVLIGLHANVAGIITIGIGTIALVTGLSGVCPTYNLFGISTLDKENAFFAKIKSMPANCMRMMNGNGGRMCWPSQRPTEEAPKSQP